VRSRSPLAALCLSLIACGEPTASGDVLLISVDTLRADHLGSCGYERATSPALRALGYVE
jgi:hypothetical protein